MAKKEFKTKKIKARGKDVNVDTVEVNSENGVLVLHAKATIGETEYTEPITFGPVNAVGASYDATAMQKDLDKHREKVANIAAYRQQLKEMKDQLE